LWWPLLIVALQPAPDISLWFWRRREQLCRLLLAHCAAFWLLAPLLLFQTVSVIADSRLTPLCLFSCLQVKPHACQLCSKSCKSMFNHQFLFIKPTNATLCRFFLNSSY